MRRITFVTSNKGKLEEASAALAPHGHDVVGADLKPIEIQADTLEEIARDKCAQLVGRLDAPFIVDDGGLFVEALHGFPGVFSAHALHKIGVPGILKLMAGETDRRAHFAAVVALHDSERVHLFAGRCDGRIADAPRALGHGFGFDPIFIPDEGDGRTFAQMEAAEKNDLSHRGRALAALARHLSTGT